MPHNRHDVNGNTNDPGDDGTANPLKGLIAFWPILVAIFAAGGTCATFAMQSARIDKLEARQAQSDVRLDGRLTVMDERMRGVETGMATLLERTKPHP